jgi:hypothetical protein
MEYTEIKIKVPKGYEKQVTDLVMMKIEGILSQIILAPTQVKKDEFNEAVTESYTQNKVVLPKDKVVLK